METAAFKLDAFSFPKVSIDFDALEDSTLEINFKPSGVYDEEEGYYNLNFEVSVICETNKKEIIKILCKAQFSFEQNKKINEIPDFFYPNSIAILFPYIRAFVSTVSLQANVRPIVLPTVNLMGLKDILRENTQVK